MKASPWLPLTEYSMKHKVSISTLRRRIKNSQIEFSYQEGKYLVRDEALMTQHHPIKKTERHEGHREKGPPPQNLQESGAPLAPLVKEEPVLTTANQLLAELKSAYSTILQEKELQITQLREEVADLQTLVRILENENQRLKSQGTMAAPEPAEKWFNKLDL